MSKQIKLRKIITEMRNDREKYWMKKIHNGVEHLKKVGQREFGGDFEAWKKTHKPKINECEIVDTRSLSEILKEQIKKMEDM